MKTLIDTQIQKFTFSRHVRRRAAGVIKIAPFEHCYSDVLRSIAHIDWHQENDLSNISDKSARQLIIATKKYQADLAAAGVSSDETASAYLDWLEPKIRQWMWEFDELAAVHDQQIANLIQSFE